MKKSRNWTSVVLGAIPDTYFVLGQLVIDDVDGDDTDFDGKWRHGYGGWSESNLGTDDIINPKLPAASRKIVCYHMTVHIY